MNVKTAIQSGDAAGLRSLLAEDPARANQLIQWGNKSQPRTHPLHFVSDMLFEGALSRGNEAPLVEALLAAGADCNHQAPNGETPLIGAASLGAEDVGLRLLEAGADPHARGGFGEIALHWAAMLGLDRLVAALITRGSDVNLKDTRYNAAPLGWAEHGRANPGRGAKGRYDEVIASLITAGAGINLHDHQVVGYEVDCDARLIVLRTRRPVQGSAPTSIRSVAFTGVEGYHFENDAFGNIILDLEETPLTSFLSEHRGEFSESFRQAGAPGVWASDLTAAPRLLSDRGVKAYVLSSSCGLSGWVLATGLRYQL